MKRLVCLVLSLLLLSGCAGEAKTETVVDAPAVTALELLANGIGVPECSSVTLGVVIEVQEKGGFSGSLGGTFEETEEFIHLVVDELASSSLEDAIFFDMYFDKSIGVVYSLEPEGWAKYDYDMDMTGLTGVDVSELMELPQLAEVRGGYEVTGFTTSGVVVDIVKFMFGGMDMTGESIFTCFSYDIGGTLYNMHWEAENSSGHFSINANMSRVNSTSVSLPFDPEVQFAEDGDTQAFALDCWDGETLLVQEYFGVDYIRAYEFSLGLDNYPGADEDILFLARYYFNSYSREGFVRMLSNTKPSVVNEPGAVVLVCEMADIPLDCLWESGYMSEEDVRNVREILIGK